MGKRIMKMLRISNSIVRFFDMIDIFFEKGKFFKFTKMLVEWSLV